MTLGWPSQPKSLDDYDATNSNVIETWISNAAKLDRSEERYPKIQDMLKGIDIPKELYDPDAPTPKSSTTVTLPASYDVDDLDEAVDSATAGNLEFEELLPAVNDDAEGDNAASPCQDSVRR